MPEQPEPSKPTYHIRDLLFVDPTRITASRRAHILCLFGILATLYGLYFIIGYFSIATVALEWDATQKLLLQVTACDTVVKRCSSISQSGAVHALAFSHACNKDRGKILLTSLLYSTTVDARYTSDFQTVETVTISNAMDCTNYPRFNCSAYCRIELLIPDEANTIRVKQDAGDNSQVISFDAGQDVVLNSLDVRGTSIDVKLDGATIAGRVYVSSGAGMIQVYNSVIGSTILSSSDNNIVWANNNLDEHVVVEHRSTSGSTCFASQNAGIVLNPNGKWEACELSGTSFLSQKLVNLYDTDNNGRITDSEFSDGLSTLGKCCGSGCPFINRCSVAYRGTYVPLNASYVSRSEFISNILFENDTSVVPSCHQVGEFQLPAASSTRQRRIKLSTTHGNIFVGLGNPYSRRFVSNTNNSTSASVHPSSFIRSEGGRNGLRLMHKDALRLTTELRDVYGSGSLSDKDEYVFAVLDVIQSPGVPKATFVYTNQPVYFTLDPAILSPLSLGLLNPTVKRYRIHFTSSACSQNTLLTSAGNNSISSSTTDELNHFFADVETLQDRNQRIGELASQLERALTPRSRSSLWGALVYVDDDHVPEQPKLMTIRKNLEDDTFDLVPFPSSPTAKAALYVSIIASFIGSLLGLGAFRTLVMPLLAKRLKDDFVQKKLMLSRDDEESKQAARATQLQGGDLGKTLKNPLESPILLCDILIVRPMKSYLTDSLALFMNKKVFVLDHNYNELYKFIPNPFGLVAKKVAPQAKNTHGDSKVESGSASFNTPRKRHVGSITMKEFMLKYERFCFTHRLNMESNTTDIKKYLAQMYGVKVRGFIADRVLGIRWRTTKLELQPGPSYQQWAPKFNFSLHCAEFKVEVLEVVQETGSSPNPEFLLRKFMGTFTQVTGRLDDFVSFKPLLHVLHEEPEVVDGFEDCFLSFCDWILPGAIDTVPEEELEVQGVVHSLVKVETIRGIEWAENAKGSMFRISWRYYVDKGISTLLHIVVLSVGPGLLILLVSAAQFTYAKTTALDGHSLSEVDLLYLVFKNTFNEYQVMATFKYSVFGLGVFTLLSYVLLFVGYLGEGIPSWLQQVRGKGFGIVLNMFLFLVLVIVSICAVWVMLATFLNPSKFLPYGTSAVVFVSTTSWQFNRLQKASQKVKEQVQVEIHDRMRKKLRHSLNMAMKKKRIKRKEEVIEAADISTKMIPPLGTTDQRTSRDTLRRRKSGLVTSDPVHIPAAATVLETSFQTASQTETDVFDPSELFDLLDQRHNDVLNMDEFNYLFDCLGLSIRQGRRELLFAYCDSGNTNGEISREEFLDSFEWLETSIIDDLTRDLGLSHTQIAVAVCHLVVLLIAVFVFLFIAVASFKTQGNFAAVIQSSMISMIGLVSTQVQKKPKGEELKQNSPDMLKKYIDDTLTATEAEG